MSIDDAIKLNFSILDKLDLLPYVEKGEDPYAIMDAIEDAYNNHEFPEDIEKEIEKSDTLQGVIFNYITIDDFMEYLHSRYGTTFNSEVRYWVVNRGTDT